MKLILVKFSMGRVALHVACLMLDHKWAWHLSGIVREFHHNA